MSLISSILGLKIHNLKKNEKLVKNIAFLQDQMRSFLNLSESLAEYSQTMNT